MSEPYVIELQNGDDRRHRVDLFAFHWNNGKPNFGLPQMVKVTNLMTPEENGYAAIVSFLADNPTIIGKWRFQSTTRRNIQHTAVIKELHPNGHGATEPLSLAIMMDAYQQQSELIDVTKPVHLDGTVSLNVGIEPFSSLIISMFPIKVASMAAKLKESNDLADFIAPRLSGSFVAPVIIHTDAKVRSASLTHLKPKKKSANTRKASGKKGASKNKTSKKK